MTYTYTRLLVRNMGKTFRFYRDVLGLTPKLGGEDDVYAEFETGATTLALFRRSFMAPVVAAQDKPAAPEGQDTVALIFAVDNVDQAYRKLSGKGIAFVTQPEDRPEWGLRTAHFRDPDGALIEIYSPLSAGID